MKITVGHLLIVIGVVGVAGLGPLRKLNSSKLLTYVDKLDGQFSSLKQYIPYAKFKPDASPTPLSNIIVENPPEIPSVVSDPLGEIPVEAKKEEPVAAAEPVPVEAAKIEEPVPVAKPAVRKRRSRRKKAVAPKVEKAAKAVPAAASQPGVDPLVGSYVALTLKSGREIKGVYQQKTATNYVIELPGMGPFEYPISNVLSIKPAE